MAQNNAGTTGERETGVWTAASLIALALFFAGCACFTLADIFLGSNNRVSAVLAILGVPLFLIGGVLICLRARTGTPQGRRRRSRAT